MLTMPLSSFQHMRGLRCSINSELRKSVCICNFGFAGGLVISAGLLLEVMLVCVLMDLLAGL